MAIHTPYLLLILVFIFLNFQKCLATLLQQNTKYSATTIKSVVSVHYIFSLHCKAKIKQSIKQLDSKDSELLRFL